MGRGGLEDAAIKVPKSEQRTYINQHGLHRTAPPTFRAMDGLSK